jgi:hypothetical protein
MKILFIACILSVLAGCAGVKYHGQVMSRSNPYYKTVNRGGYHQH